MSVETTRDVMSRYWESTPGDTSMMADDVLFTVMATGDEHRGPQGVQQMLHHIYQVAFHATAEARNVVIGDGHAVWEGEFIGRHIGEFAGIPATGKDVRIPLCVVYDVDGELLTRGRIYFETPALMAQLGLPLGSS